MKRKRKIKDKAISIPHLTYRVILRDAIHPSWKDEHPSCERTGKGECVLWIPAKFRKMATVMAHECLHAVQFMAEDRSFDMMREQEHAAYLLHYIMAEAMGIRLEVIE